MAADNHALVHHIYQAGWIATFAFLICGAVRLARFNIQGSESGDLSPAAHRYFVGLPIPAAAAVIAATVHAAGEPITDWYWGLAWLALLFGLGFLMVSTIRYPSFKEGDFGRRHPFVLTIFIALVAALIYVYSQVVLLVMALAYLSWGLLGLRRRRLFGVAG